MSYFRPSAYDKIHREIDDMIREVRRQNQPMATRLSDSAVLTRGTLTLSERFHRYWEKIRSKW